ncbi:hypothetical protein GCM10009808_01220 [Microbacterium sediminicola]|uniref:Hydantoinase/oxoprolinase family protein n=1 Tax=Microbacterium sediminicola TaxID=415210 RepID=A0ABN2HHC8_9MICO
MTGSPRWRIATDVGGTFTDLVLDDGAQLRAFKAPTTPDDPARGVLDAVAVAARAVGVAPTDLLAGSEVFVHGTTRALNAMLTGTTAPTALLVTAGHPDILLFREGGRHSPFDLSTEYPKPLVPRRLTFEVGGRLLADGSEMTPLDEDAVLSAIEAIKAASVEAVAVCLLWSVVDGSHERRVGELLAEHLPGVAVTLSHELNPVMREYRRASSAVIDASLKPLMAAYIDGLEGRLRDAGLGGQLLLVSSTGSSLLADMAADAPIHTLNSGPAMAPSAARHVVAESVETVGEVFDAIVFDTGGTTCDISLVRESQVVSTRETWIGPIGAGHITGFSSVDIRSIAAGGGSIAEVDEWGLLHVGPGSAGAVPGPACYGRGGTAATVTDASVVAGLIDPDTFLDGSLTLDRGAAERAVGAIAHRMGVDLLAAADAILSLATEQMVNAIELITLGQGVDPRSAVLVGGGGAAGLNIVEIARRLGTATAVIPAFGSVLAAAGGMLAPLAEESSMTFPTSSDRFDAEGVGGVIAELSSRVDRFAAAIGVDRSEITLDWSVEARYRRQVWDLVVPVPDGAFKDGGALALLVAEFHRSHALAYGTDDPTGTVEFLTWRVRASHGSEAERGFEAAAPARAATHRDVSFSGVLHTGARVVPVRELADTPVDGPAIIEATATSVALPPGARAALSPQGHILIEPYAAAIKAKG